MDLCLLNSGESFHLSSSDTKIISSERRRFPSLSRCGSGCMIFTSHPTFTLVHEKNESISVEQKSYFSSFLLA
jgi:hypothetical protein